MAAIKPSSPRRPQPALATTPTGDLSVIIREARLRFMEAFEAQCEALAPGSPDTPLLTAQEAVKRLHRMAGLGGTLGFPRVSAKAAEMEEQLVDRLIHPADLRDQVAELRAAYGQDVANPTIEPAAPAAPDASGRMCVLLVEDEPLQRRVLSAQLTKAGHAPIEVTTGEEALEAARRHRPDVILLDVELPGIDGYTVCRMLKADPELAAIPIAFLSAHADVESRLTGLTHGADDYLTKPIDARELGLRVQVLARRNQRPETRPKPEAASAEHGGERTQVASGTVAAPLAPCVLVGDDDPEIVRIIDAHLAALGYRRILVYDGAQALEQARAQRPDAVILDLRMPRLNGFDLLAALRTMTGHRPKAIVLSQNSRQEDVIRAFHLGADDFLVKPLNPQELLGRVARLVPPPAHVRRTA